MRRGTITILFLSVLLLSPRLGAQDFDRAPFERFDAESTDRLDFAPWATFLNTYVRADADGIHRLDYRKVGELETKRLAAYVDELAGLEPHKLNRDEQMAYWINLYNALTVKTVLEHYPVESIKEIALPPAAEGGGPWDAPLVEVLGAPLSLNDIEHRILRPIWADERIHYAVNCAAVGCPNLAAVPFTGRTLDGLLDRAAAAFINHPRAVALDGDTLTLSSLFDWYGEDFGADREELLEHLAEHAASPLDEALEAFSGEIVFGYDWALNGF
ncbi:MAG: DUF547 domain-containing protein [Acidobacteriota bacterium]